MTKKSIPNTFILPGNHQRIVIGPAAQDAVDSSKGQAEGQRTTDSDVVSKAHPSMPSCHCLMPRSRGLDNAGKTTIVKKIMGEDINTVSPTLGFIIKTVDYEG